MRPIPLREEGTGPILQTIPIYYQEELEERGGHQIQERRMKGDLLAEKANREFSRAGAHSPDPLHLEEKRRNRN